jgi:hypothetical protein
VHGGKAAVDSPEIRMSHCIPKALPDRMQFLEQIDAKVRKDGTFHNL